MKNFLKSMLIAVAMLLSVNVWAGNPENAPSSTNVQNAVIVEPVANPNDVQQVPCILVIHSRTCGDFPTLAFSVVSSSDCDTVENWIYNVLAMVGC